MNHRLKPYYWAACATCGQEFAEDARADSSREAKSHLKVHGDHEILWYARCGCGEAVGPCPRVTETTKALRAHEADKGQATADLFEEAGR